MRIALLIGILAFVFSNMKGQSVEGTWKILNKKGAVESHVKVYEENGYLYAQCIKLLDAAVLHHCKKCKGADKDKPLEGMLLFKDCKFDGTKWSDGQILDPKRGKWYDCQVSLKSSNVLKVRGFVGNPLFGKTLLWHREE